MAKNRFHVNVSKNNGATNIQVLSPGCRVIYDHLTNLDGAQRHCDFLNGAIEEVLDQYVPLAEAARLFYDAYEANDMVILVEARKMLFVAVENLSPGPPSDRAGLSQRDASRKPAPTGAGDGEV